jgi:hypothetical protein
MFRALIVLLGILLGSQVIVNADDVFSNLKPGTNVEVRPSSGHWDITILPADASKAAKEGASSIHSVKTGILVVRTNSKHKTSFGDKYIYSTIPASAVSRIISLADNLPK